VEKVLFTKDEYSDDEEEKEGLRQEVEPIMQSKFYFTYLLCAYSLLLCLLAFMQTKISKALCFCLKLCPFTCLPHLLVCRLSLLTF
jgi:hypothetical protein